MVIVGVAAVEGSKPTVWDGDICVWCLIINFALF